MPSDPADHGRPDLVRPGQAASTWAEPDHIKPGRHAVQNGSHARPADADLVVSTPFPLPPFALFNGNISHESFLPLTLAELGICYVKFF